MLVIRVDTPSSNRSDWFGSWDEFLGWYRRWEPLPKWLHIEAVRYYKPLRGADRYRRYLTVIEVWIE